MENILPVITGAVLCFVFGFVWYGPLFGKKWATANGKSVEDCSGKMPVKNMAIEFVNCVVVAAGFRWVLMGPHGALAFSAIAALVAGVAFYLTSSVSRNMWAGRSKVLVLIEGGHGIIMLLLLAVLYNFI